MDDATAFEQHRAAIESLGYRMLGSRADAEDVAQETYLRWRQSDPAAVRSPRSWLLKTASRLALDRLKSAQRKREEYVGPWLPEPWLVQETSPADAAAVDESITIALMLSLERLNPAERAALLLHDVFGLSFDEVAETLGRTAIDCRQLAPRARASVRTERPRFDLDPAKHRRLLDAFISACRHGDLDGIKRLLAEDAVAITDSGGRAVAARRILRTADVVGRFFARVLAKAGQRAGAELTAEPVRFNGLPGLLLCESGVAVTAIGFAIARGRIERIFVHRNPDKLAAFQRAHRWSESSG